MKKPKQPKDDPRQMGLTRCGLVRPDQFRPVTTKPEATQIGLTFPGEVTFADILEAQKHAPR